MDAVQTRSFNSLVKQFLNVRLPDHLAGRIAFPELHPDAQRFTVRMLTLMQRASYPANDFTPFLIRALSTIVSSSLPCAWAGRIPPITMPGRHQKLDAYVANQSWAECAERPVFIDLGCGFPPATAMDTARNLPDWSIFGVDREFSPYVLYDPDGHYACFDRNGDLLYLQTRLTPSGSALNDNPTGARSRFKALFARMLPQLPDIDERGSTIVDLGGNRLIHNHIRDFEAGNLTFIEADINDLELPPARATRCMNVLLYFRKPEREKLLAAIGRLLEDDGLLIAGFNHFLGSGARYLVYRKTINGIAPGEFAFSLDNLRPIGIAPWYTIHAEDPDASCLADLTAAVRGDPTFWPAFNNRVDHLLHKYEICQRSEDGFLQFHEPPTEPVEWIGKMTALWQQIEAEDFACQAVDALGRAGYTAWINSVGDIAVKPFAFKQGG